MIRGRCPTCGKSYEVQAIDDLPAFPFCSDRCRLLDLGRWIDGAYVIPGPEAPRPEDAVPDEDDGASPS
jgi:endogenous inhibitor of DNA gyrase (YacG/DUF329 family)